MARTRPLGGMATAYLARWPNAPLTGDDPALRSRARWPPWLAGPPVLGGSCARDEAHQLDRTEPPPCPVSDAFPSRRRALATPRTAAMTATATTGYLLTRSRCRPSFVAADRGGARRPLALAARATGRGTVRGRSAVGPSCSSPGRPTGPQLASVNPGCHQGGVEPSTGRPWGRHPFLDQHRRPPGDRRPRARSARPMVRRTLGSQIPSCRTRGRPADAI